MTGTRMDYGDGVMVTAWQDACAGLVAQEIVKPSALWRPPDPLETRTAAALTILEGYRDTWYRCSEGAWTIGYGHSVSDPAPPYEWTNLFDQVHFVALLLADIRRAEAAAADNFGFWRPEGPKGPDVWWSTFSAVQQRRAQALIEMAFQLGGAGQRGFKRMWQALGKCGSTTPAPRGGTRTGPGGTKGSAAPLRAPGVDSRADRHSRSGRREAVPRAPVAASVSPRDVPARGTHCGVEHRSRERGKRPS